jgi:hypothetical protein
MDLGGHHEAVLLHVGGLLDGGWREPVLVKSDDERAPVVPLAHSIVQDIQVLRKVQVTVVLWQRGWKDRWTCPGGAMGVG